MTSRRSTPEKLLVVPIKRESVIVMTDNSKSVDVKVILAGRAPEGEPQIEDGDRLSVSKGGQRVWIGDIELIQIDYKQILFIYED